MNDHFDEADEALGLNEQEADLYKRHLSNLNGPGGVDNPDGSRSSLYQAVQEHNDKFYNIPTVWNGKRETEPWTRPSDGKTFDVPNDTAMQNVAKEGWEKFPSYKTPDEADARYDQMHGFMERDTEDYLNAKQGAPKVGPGTPQKLIDLGEEQEGLFGDDDQLESMKKEMPGFFGKPVKTGDLGNVEPSKNIERRGDYDIFDKFRYHPLFDQIKRSLDEKRGTDGKLSKDLGADDIDRVVKEAALRTYGRKRASKIEADETWVKSLPDDLQKQVRKFMKQDAK
jgi:hypothetical protein